MADTMANTMTDTIEYILCDAISDNCQIHRVHCHMPRHIQYNESSILWYESIHEYECSELPIIKQLREMEGDPCIPNACLPFRAECFHPEATADFPNFNPNSIIYVIR